MTEPAVEIHGMSKRFRGAGALIPLPHRWGASWLERGGRHRRNEDLVDIEDDEEIDEDIEEETEQTSLEEVWALRDVSLAVDPGTLLGIIGPDGSGKTTLLRILGRTAWPTHGHAVVRGRVAPLLRTVPGLMLQGDTGRANVVHVASFFGVSRREALAHVDEIAQFSELGAKIDDRVRTYSTGGLQRFAFAIALGLNPDVLLADEVVAVGDLHFRNRCLEHIERRSADGLTLLFASHNMALVRRLCTEAILLDSGRIVERGAVEHVIACYEGGAQRSRPRPSEDADEDHPELLALAAGGPLSAVGIYSSTGQPADLLRVEDEALVEIVLELDEAPITLRCALTLVAPDAVLRSVQPRAFTVDVPGRCYVSARVPPGSLQDGHFHARVAVSAFNDDGRELVSQRNDAFEIEVFGEDEKLPSGAVRVRRGVAKRDVALEWSVSDQ